MTQLVFLPGMMCDDRLFEHQICALKDDYDCHIPNIGGHANMAALGGAVLDQVTGCFALIGLSLGGILAMEIMKQAADRVSHLVLMDTNPLAELDSVKAGRAAQIQAVHDGDLIAVMRDQMKPRYLVDGPNKTAILDLCMDMARDLGPNAFVNQSYALRDRPDYQNVLRQITCPSLIIYGAHDTLCPKERHELMHDLIPNSKLVEIPNAGHLPCLEQPDTVTHHLCTFLNTKAA